MNRTWVLCSVFVIVFLASALTRTPLTFVLKKANLQNAAVSWSHASGTVWRGEIEGVAIAGQLVGEASLKLRPSALLKGKIAYDVHSEGHLGQASGRIVLGRKTIAISNLYADINAAELVYVAPDIRRVGGSIKVQQANMKVRNKACAEASGTVTSDVVSNLVATIANQSASSLSGALSCAGPDLQLVLQGSVLQNTPLEITVNMAFGDTPSVNVQVQTDTPLLTAGLIQYGFEPNGNTYTFTRGMRALPH